MKIVLNSFSHSEREELTQEINALKKLFRINYRAEINIVDGMDKLIQWATLSAQEEHNNKRTVIITTPEIITMLNNVIIKDATILIDINKPPEEIASDIARFLACSINSNLSDKKQTLILSEKEAETIYELYTNCCKLTKAQQNIKYRVMRKLKVTNFYQLFIWWMLTDLLPPKKLKSDIRIKMDTPQYK